MAVIVEVLHPRTGEVRQRLRLERFPTSLGRQLDNDLVLDDPYVDAHHARFVLDVDGSLVLEDLGSVNKLATTTHPQADRVRCVPGVELRVGRTRLRVRDGAEPVAPALSLTGAADRDTAHAWHARPTARVAAIVIAAGSFGLSGWLETAERNGATVALTAVMGFFLLGVMWAGVWAVGGRVVVGQFRFVAHLAIAAWFSIFAIIIGELGTWIDFLAPDNGVVEAAEGFILVLALGALIAFHLGESSLLRRSRRWRTGAIVTGLIIIVAGAFSLADDDPFTDVPKFSSVIKSIPARLVPQQTQEEFDAVIVDLRAGVDSLLRPDAK